ncbi:MAG: Uma2 family endonuclease [Gemmataceae bacterium]|nr:Uma2 family endonuclease [Gemmataceae bacterium]
MATAVIPPPAPSPTPATYQADASIATFSVARYKQMIEQGVLTALDRVELLENYIVLKMSKGPAHDGTIDAAGDTLRPLLPAGWRLRTQQTVDLADSQPEPDFAAVRGGPRAYLARHPAPADTGLLVEVANTSLLRDQRDKTRIYARAGIAVYWIINLVDRQIEVYTLPSGPADAPAYGRLDAYAPGDLVPLVLDGAQVAAVPAADLLP